MRRNSVAILPIYIYNQSVLRRKAKPVRPDRVDRPELEKLAADMFETMRNANGIGLAATQVGSLHRVVVIDVSDMEEMESIEPVVMVNPEVVAESGELILEEGCLSLPEIRDEVKRAETIRVRYKDLAFKDHEIEGSGILGRVMLHEIDHLNGVLFIDRLEPDKRKLLRGRLNKLAKGEVETSYPIVGSPAPARRQAVEAK